MIGNLVIDQITFVFEESDPHKVQSLYKFIESGKHARNNKDIIYGTKELSSFKYAWGYFYEDLAYKNYSELKRNPFWDWLPQTLHQSLMTFFYQNPSGHSDFDNVAHFREAFRDQNNGSIGCQCPTAVDLDVFDLPSWDLWKMTFYSANQKSFIWKDEYHDFLPNSAITERILERELKSHNKYDKVQDSKIAQAFHDEVMRLKGEELRAYAVKIGSEIAKSNYYVWEEKLSDNEQKASKNAPRKIFSMINRKGEKMYISLDHAHGMFEFHNQKGEHLGEFKFDGSHNSDPDATHNLKTL